MRIILGITGATGALYAAKFLEKCVAAEKYLILSHWGKYVLKEELDISEEKLKPWVKHIFSNEEMTSPLASGSNSFDAYIILPCTVSTLGKIAAGIGDNLITRVAQVAIKEGRRLVLCPRETPLSALALGNCLKLSRIGVTIMPASPPFYTHPSSVDDLAGAFVDKVLQILGMESSKGWREEELE
ncbi:MAG: UbiX family flavin prenyltransferase [bacterium]|nr:UbiX family flavin prenyltransferase [bacterium]